MRINKMPNIPNVSNQQTDGIGRIDLLVMWFGVGVNDETISRN